MIYTKLFVGGSEVVDSENYSVKKSIGENNESSSFSASVPNYVGTHSGDWTVGDEVNVYADKDVLIAKGDELTTENDGTITGATYTTGIVGDYALRANDSAYVGVTTINLAQGSSISFWIKPRVFSNGYIDTQAYKNYFCPVAVLSTDAHDSCIDLYKSATSNIRTQDEAGNSYNSSNTTSWDTSTWYHIVIVFGSDTTKFYKDGIALGTANAFGANTLKFDRIGQGYSGSTNSEVDLDEVLIYNKALNETEISTLYNKEVVTNGLIAKYSFEEGSGTDALDTAKSYIDTLISNQTIFTGILEDKKFSGKELNEKISLAGRDYSARLMDRTVEPEVYTSLSAGSIVKDIVNKYVDGITVSGVNDSSTIINRIAFAQTPVFDAIKKLADLSNYTFYVDEDKDLHFEEKASISSGQIFEAGSNILKSDFTEHRDTVYNKIWVYGDRYLDGYKETFTGVAGSVYTLLYNPHNTSVQMSGTVPIAIQPGGIYQMTYSTGSLVRYLVDYDAKQIILTSGTSQGNNLYIGSKIDIVYDRSLPIVKVGDNEPSKEQYGTRVKIIQDKDIKDPQTAEQVLSRELEKSSFPQKEGKLDIKGVLNITPGQTCIVNEPFYDISNQTYDILEANYNFNTDNNLSDSVLSIKLNKKLPDITDTMKDILLAMKKLQGQDISTSDFLTRLQYTLGSIGIRQSGLNIYSSTVTGSCYHVYSTEFVPPVNPFNCGSATNQGYCAGSWTGSASAFSPFVLEWSGGYF